MTRNEDNIIEFLKVKYRKHKSVIKVVALIVMVICIYTVLFYATKKVENEEKTNIVEANKDVETFEAKEKVINQKVYISGEITNPGVYTFNDGDRIIDIIKYAGGETEDASLDNINLAEIVVDEQHIIIPNFNEEIAISSNSSAFKKININNATEDELTELNGVGEATAKNIIKYREENGKFNSIEEIMNVSGIGEKTFEKFEDEITVK